MENTTDNNYKKSLAFVEATQKSFDDSIESWTAYIQSLKEGKPRELQELMLAFRGFKDAEHEKKRREAWEMLLKNN